MLLLDPIPCSFRREITCLPWNRSDITTAKETTAILVCACVRVYRKTEKHSTVTCFFLSFITLRLCGSHSARVYRWHLPNVKVFLTDILGNIFLELTRWRNFDVRSRTGTTNARVHQSRMLRWYAKKSSPSKKFVHCISLGRGGGRERRGEMISLEKNTRYDFWKMKVFRNFLHEHWRRWSDRWSCSHDQSHEENWLDLGRHDTLLSRGKTYTLYGSIFEKRTRR